jgi:nucleoside-diphosphate-sugar epimerase
MKLLVTGICGRLGRALAVEGIAQGHSVVGMDLVPWPQVKTPVPKGLEFVTGTYEDFPLMEKLLPGCHALIHTAGPHGSFVKKFTLAQFLHSNVESVGQVLEIAVKSGVRNVVLSSTMEVLIGRTWETSGIAFVDEDCPPRCDSAYSISRLLVEQLGREFSYLRKINIASLRYVAFGYGADRDLGPGLLARSLAPRDVARACLAAAAKDSLRGDVFHIGPQSPLTNTDIVAAMKDPAAVLEKYYPGAMNVLNANHCELSSDHFWPATSIRKAKLMLGWEPEYTFEKWLEEHGWKPKQN